MVALLPILHGLSEKHLLLRVMLGFAFGKNSCNKLSGNIVGWGTTIVARTMTAAAHAQV